MNCGGCIKSDDVVAIFKYAMLEGTHPIFFLNGTQHRDMQKLNKVTSAGHVVLKKSGEVETFGESLSLRMSPASSDARIIKRFLEMAVNGGISG